MNTSLHDVAIESMELVLAHLDEYHLYIAAAHLFRALDTLQNHIVDGCTCTSMKLDPSE
jgi:hypothetical protein